MKTLPISNNTANQTFNGLWGKSQTVSTNGKTKNINLIYHPFLDESKEFIEIIKKQNNNVDIINNSEYVTRVQDRLPFTESDYVSYKVLGEDRISIPTLTNKVEKALKDRFLIKYLNGFEKKSNKNSWLTLLRKIINK